MTWAYRAGAAAARLLVPSAAGRRLCATLAERRLPQPHRGPALAALAMAEERSGDPDAAIAHLRAALAADPGQAAWREQLAHWYAEQGQRRADAGAWELAAVAYRHALAYDDRRPDWHARFRVARERAPQWVFHAPEVAVRTPAEVPGAQTVGLVAPIDRNVAVAGWIPADAGGDRRVQFLVNGEAVADAPATVAVRLPDGDSYWQFRRCLRQLWSYAGAGDVLEVVHRDQRLPILDSGLQYRFPGRRRRVEELRHSLREGKVFDKYGTLRRSIRVDTAWQAAMLDLYTQLCKELEQQFGLVLFPFYGTMLGAVRDGHFIGHDNDFDTAYVSSYSSPQAVRTEFKRVCQFLLDRGYSLRVKPTHTWVTLPGTAEKLDIFFAWYDDQDYLRVSFGYHGPPVHRCAELAQFRTARLGDVEIPVPRHAEAVLTQLYGEHWREPDPGFSHHRETLVRHPAYQLSEADASELRWQEFYREDRREEPSRFAEFVAGRLPPASRIVELGCGAGRDALYFAGLGHQVTGADQSVNAIAQALDAAREVGKPGVRFELLDVSAPAEVERLLQGELAAAEPDRLAVYLRFLLHCLDERTEAVLLDTLCAWLPAGARLFAEFRTTRDAHLAKVYDDHYRRYIDEQRLAERLRHRWGMAVEHLDAGRGRSPYRGEDPHLARLVARITSRSARRRSRGSGASRQG